MVLIDGTLIPTQRRPGKANRRNYSGKHRHHGLHFLAMTDENGHLIWISTARPGRTHDITSARHDHVLAHLRAAGLGTLSTPAISMTGRRPGVTSRGTVACPAGPRGACRCRP
ncbi:transposase family protein [Streptomyces sp. NPDC048155]|uniref:transposase family protein n=1 Tax=Streptomyces sp. NPDC048155 TaxID=3154818 RepID=UPI0034048B36